MTVQGEPSTTINRLRLADVVATQHGRIGRERRIIASESVDQERSQDDGWTLKIHGAQTCPNSRSTKATPGFVPGAPFLPPPL